MAFQTLHRQQHNWKSTDPDPAWWHWTHGGMMLNTKHVFNFIVLDLDQMKIWNAIFIFVFFAQKPFPWLRKITVEPLMLHGLFDQSPCYVSGHGDISVVLLSMEGLRVLRFKQNILICVRTMNGGLTGLEWHQGEYDIIFIFGWPNPLMHMVRCVVPQGGPHVPPHCMIAAELCWWSSDWRIPEGRETWSSSCTLSRNCSCS